MIARDPVEPIRFLPRNALGKASCPLRFKLVSPSHGSLWRQDGTSCQAHQSTVARKLHKFCNLPPSLHPSPLRVDNSQDWVRVKIRIFAVIRRRPRIPRSEDVREGRSLAWVLWLWSARLRQPAAQGGGSTGTACFIWQSVPPDDASR
jgi:hypothetical protein